MGRCRGAPQSVPRCDVEHELQLADHGHPACNRSCQLIASSTWAFLGAPIDLARTRGDARWQGLQGTKAPDSPSWSGARWLKNLSTRTWMVMVWRRLRTIPSVQHAAQRPCRMPRIAADVVDRCWYPKSKESQALLLAQSTRQILMNRPRSLAHWPSRREIPTLSGVPLHGNRSRMRERSDQHQQIQQQLSFTVRAANNPTTFHPIRQPFIV